MSVRLRTFLFACFAISISAGVFYNLLGYMLPIFFFMLYTLSKGSVKIRIEEAIPIIGLITFLVIKSMKLSNYVGYSDYFSALTFIFNFMEFALVSVFLLLNYHCCNKEVRAGILIFLVLYHITITISICLLGIHGTGLYRSRSSEGGILLAPQNFTIYAAFMGIYYAYKIMQSQRKRIIYIGLFLLNFVYIVMSSYTTQVFFFVFGVFTVFFYTKIKKKSTRIVVIAIVGIALLIIQDQIVPFLSYINETMFASNPPVNVRIKEIIRLLENGSITGTDLGKRVELITVSLTTFLNNPICGIEFNNYNSLEHGITIGSHCQWADDLGRYGLVGMFFYISFLRIIWNKLSKISGIEDNPVKSAVFVYIMVYGFFNPVISEGTVMFVLIIQLLLKLDSDRVLERNIYSHEEDSFFSCDCIVQ